MRQKKALTITELARMGGKARAEKLSSKELSQQGKKAANARWKKTKKQK